MLQCAKKCGFPNVEINILLEFAKDPKNKKIVMDTDSLFRKAQYPSRVIDWSRIYNDVDIEYFLTPHELMILTFMIRHMWTSNLIQVSQNDLLKYTKISCKGKVNLSINELIKKGCITIKCEGNNRQKTIYMVNPSLGIVGTDCKKSLQVKFWQLVGSELDDKGKVISYAEPHKKWIELTADKHYSVNRKSQSKGTICFNVIEEVDEDIDIKKDSSTSKETAKSDKSDFDINKVEEEITENLPFN